MGADNFLVWNSSKLMFLKKFMLIVILYSKISVNLLNYHIQTKIYMIKKLSKPKYLFANWILKVHPTTLITM